MIMSIPDSIQSFILDARVRGLRPASLHLYERQLLAFSAWAAAVGVTDIDQVDALIVRRYIVSLQDRGLRPTSIRTAGRCLRVWLRFLAAEELIDASPMRTVRLPKAPTPKPDVFTVDELQRLLAAADADEKFQQRNRAILLALLDTGARIREFTLLQRADIDLDTGKITIRHEISKTATRRVVFLGVTARAALGDYLATLPPLAPDAPLWHGRQGALTIDGMHKILTRMGRRAGVHPCGPHRFRRTFATQMLHDGADAKSTAALLGHSVDELLRSYVMSNDETLRAAHAQHGPVDKLLK